MLGNEQFAEGIIESLGNEPPATHKDLVVDQHVWFWHRTGVQLTIEDGVEHYLVRFNDIWSEI